MMGRKEDKRDVRRVVRKQKKREWYRREGRKETKRKMSEKKGKKPRRSKKEGEVWAAGVGGGREAGREGIFKCPLFCPRPAW